jgi:lipoate-protein ligase A
MRLPRQDTPLRLPAEAPRDGLWRDEALLDAVLATGQPRMRWWTAASPAVVLGLGLRHRATDVVDSERTSHAGIEVLTRQAGGGALLLDEHMLCGAICLPTTDRRVTSDLTESYRWLGEALARVLGARRIDVGEARADVAALRAQAADPVARALLACCYGALSPHEVARGSAKVVGMAQVRRRGAALFQFGILLGDQSPLASLLRMPDEATREALRGALQARTAGLDLSDQVVSAAVAAIAAAMPGEP